MTENDLRYTLIRSRRKTIAIHITRDAAIEVRAPLAMSKANIEKFIAAKEKWIRKHLDICRQQISECAGFSIHYGDWLLICGKKYPVQAKDGGVAGFDGTCVYLPPGLSDENIKQAVIQLYKIVAKQVLTRKVTEYAKQMGVRPTAVKVNSAKTRWGSCSGKNSVNFSWRLIMADEEAVDYVVVHELAHIKEHNHSDRFWAVVASVLPDYKERQAKLKELQKRLINENWE